MKPLATSGEYAIAARRIAGTRAEKLEQIDQAIQELVDIRLLESVGDRRNVQFMAVPRRTPWLPMTMAIVVMLVLLVLLLGAGPARAQDAGNPPQAPPTASAKPADDVWSRVTFGATLEGYYECSANRPDDRVVALRAYDTRSNTFGIQQAAFIVEQPPDVEKDRRYVWWIGNKTGAW